MRTLHTAYRVSDLDTSLAFYSALGYEVIGKVHLDDEATLTMLSFPGEATVTLELVHRPSLGTVELGTGFSHLVVQVEDVAAACEVLSNAGLRPESVQRPGGPEGPQTSWLTDPDGYRLELVQWPPGHAEGITRDDFA